MTKSSDMAHNLIQAILYIIISAHLKNITNLRFMINIRFILYIKSNLISPYLQSIVLQILEAKNLNHFQSIKHLL